MPLRLKPSAPIEVIAIANNRAKPTAVNASRQGNKTEAKGSRSGRVGRRPAMGNAICVAVRWSLQNDANEPNAAKAASMLDSGALNAKMQDSVPLNAVIAASSGGSTDVKTALIIVRIAGPCARQTAVVTTQI